MSFAKTIEMSAESDKSFEDAIRQGVETARRTLDHIQGVWVKEQEVVMNEGQIKGWRVHMKVTFRLEK